MDLSFLAFAYLAGSASTVNPCGFAMLPAYVSFIVGDADGAAQAPATVRLWRAVRVGLAVTAAFIGVFAVAGFVIAYVSRAIVGVMPWLALAVGVVLVVYGVAILAGRGRVSVQLPNPVEGRGGNRSAVLFGVGFAIASLSCTLPVFTAVVAGSLATRGLASGVVGFAAYGVGMGTIVLAVAISVAFTRDRLVRWLRRQGRHLRWISGAVLALAGAYIVLYWSTALATGGVGQAPGVVKTVSGLAAAASAFLGSGLGRAVVGLLTVGVLAAVVAGLIGRGRVEEGTEPPATRGGAEAHDEPHRSNQVTLGAKESS